MLNVKGFGKFLEGGKQKKIRIKGAPAPLRKKKTSRSNARSGSVAPSNPYAALMTPLVIIPHDPDGKVVVADAGSIIKRLDQNVLYRDRISPLTQRGDEIMVQYGKPTDPQIGWITNKISPTATKPVQGPTFLVTTQAEGAISAWDSLRLKIARARKTNSSYWFAPWLVLNGSKYPQEVREVTRLFGGKPIKNEAFEVRCQRLFQLILHTEIDMSTAKAKQVTAKKSGKKKAAKEAPEKEVSTKKKSGKKTAAKPEKKTKTKSKSKEGKSGDFTPRSKDQDEYIIKRLIQENPRRAGSEKAKIWDKLKKGTTVAEFCDKGGSRASVARFIQNGWVKLLRPSGSKGSE